MSYQPSYYEMLAAERANELEREIAHNQLVAQVDQRSPLWRRGVRLLGRTLVAVGTRMDDEEQSEQTIVYGS
jgi:hypothetical protein